MNQDKYLMLMDKTIEKSYLWLEYSKLFSRNSFNKTVVIPKLYQKNWKITSEVNILSEEMNSTGGKVISNPFQTKTLLHASLKKESSTVGQLISILLAAYPHH